MQDINLHTDSGELLTRIINGEELAFEELFLSMYPALHRYSWRLTLEEDIANDIVSDVFLKILETHNSLSHVRDIRSYLFTTVRNQTLNYLKKRAAEKRRQQEPVTQLDEKVYEDSLKALLDAETIRLLMAAIGTLPEECGKVVLLGLEGHSTSDIARRLGISAPAVSQQKARAVKLLRDKLGTTLLIVLIILID